MDRGYPIGYIRRSSADAANPGDVSREAQEAAVRELARRDGYNGETRILTDWDKSADPDKESRRTGYLAMLAAIERGEVSVVYAASLDRLYRSMRTFVRLTDAAKLHGTRIVTLREGVLGGDGSPMAQAFAEITAVFSGLELRTAKARAAGGLAVRRERGDHCGMVGYGWRLARTPDGKLARTDKGGNILEPDPDRPLGPILAAVRGAGSILGGCKLLQDRGIPAPDGGAIWGSTTLRRIIENNAPELLPKAGPTGRRTPVYSRLAQLLMCHCGHPLTPEPGRKGYRCRIGVRLGSAAHGLTYVPERALMPWIRAQAARYELPAEVEITAPGNERRARLDAERVQATRLALVPGVDLTVVQERLAAITDALAGLEDETTAEDLGPIDWEYTPPVALNAQLRAYWKAVYLDANMRPIRADWRIRRMQESEA